MDILIGRHLKDTTLVNLVATYTAAIVGSCKHVVIDQVDAYLLRCKNILQSLGLMQTERKVMMTDNANVSHKHEINIANSCICLVT